MLFPTQIENVIASVFALGIFGFFAVLGCFEAVRFLINKFNSK